MLTQYIQAAMRRTKYEILADDNPFYGEIPGIQGVWANASTLEQCRDELAQTLEDWLLLSISRHLPIPQIDGIDLSVKEVA